MTTQCLEEAKTKDAAATVAVAPAERIRRQRSAEIQYKIRHDAIKRIFDIAFSFIVLAVCLPIFLLIGILIKCTSKGPVFYSQERISRGGKPFRCYKLRSMHMDADKRLKKILDTNPLLRLEWEDKHKLTNDPRVIPLGAFLRKTSLDELPQFWNVLIGDLSVVGPRPLVQQEVSERLGPKAGKILSVRPGITGIWQTSGRSDISYSKRIALDEKYVDRRSFWLDIGLIAKTIPSMIFSKGAY